MAQPSDIIVVGAGLIGSLAALELVKQGARVRVLEHRAIGAEASGAAAGILGPQLELTHDADLLRVGEESLQRHQHLADYLRTEHRQEVGFRKIDALLYDSSLAERSAKRVRDQALVNPASLTQAVAKAAQNLGAQFKLGERVQFLLVQEGDQCVGVQTAQERYNAQQVLIAAGSWTMDIAGIPLTPESVLPLKGQLLRVRAPASGLDAMLFFNHSYVVPSEDGSWILGSTQEQSGFDKTTTAQARDHILRDAEKLVPDLKNAQVLKHWAGLRPASSDGYPILGSTRLQNCYVATGHYRHGILLAPWTARVMAKSMLQNDETEIPVNCLARRFST